MTAIDEACEWLARQDDVVGTISTGLVRELLQQIDTNVKEPPQSAPSPDWEGFGRAVMDAWPHGGLDGVGLQDYAEYFGLLRKEPGGYDPEKHGEDFADIFEPGDEFFVPTYPVKRRSTVHDTGQTHSEPMQAGKNVNGTTGEKELEPCPFCGLSMYYEAPTRRWMHPDVDDCVLWQFKVYDDDVPLWNRRAPSWREEGNEQS